MWSQTSHSTVMTYDTNMICQISHGVISRMPNSLEKVMWHSSVQTIYSYGESEANGPRRLMNTERGERTSALGRTQFTVTSHHV